MAEKIRVTHAVMVVTALLGEENADGQFDQKQGSDMIEELAPDFPSMTALTAALAVVSVMLLDRLAAERSEHAGKEATPQEMLAEFAADLASHMT